MILLKHAVERGRSAPLNISSNVMIDRFRYILSAQFCQSLDLSLSTYASALASQGNLPVALSYLQQIDGKVLEILHNYTCTCTCVGQRYHIVGQTVTIFRAWSETICDHTYFCNLAQYSTYTSKDHTHLGTGLFTYLSIC